MTKKLKYLLITQIVTGIIAVGSLSFVVYGLINGESVPTWFTVCVVAIMIGLILSGVYDAYRRLRYGIPEDKVFEVNLNIEDVMDDLSEEEMDKVVENIVKALEKHNNKL